MAQSFSNQFLLKTRSASKLETKLSDSSGEAQNSSNLFLLSMIIQEAMPSAGVDPQCMSIPKSTRTFSLQGTVDDQIMNELMRISVCSRAFF